jgi:hypothetical protein
MLTRLRQLFSPSAPGPQKPERYKIPEYTGYGALWARQDINLTRYFAGEEQGFPIWTELFDNSASAVDMLRRKTLSPAQGRYIVCFSTPLSTLSQAQSQGEHLGPYCREAVPYGGYIMSAEWDVYPLPASQVQTVTNPKPA